MFCLLNELPILCNHMYMKIFFASAFHYSEKQNKNFELIHLSLKNRGIRVVSTFNSSANELFSKGELARIKDRKELHYKLIKKGILWCDSCIFEISEPDFNLGLEASAVVEQKKHILCLSLHKEPLFMTKSRFFSFAHYNSFTLDQIINSFIDTSKNALLSERFNMFITKRQAQHLKKLADKKGINMSEYVRLLIEQDTRDQ